MIIVVAPSDLELIEAAQDQSKNFPEIYGQTYILDGNTEIPTLGHNENLFVSGHAVHKGDSGSAEIGDKSGGLDMNGLELWKELKGIFPDMYRAGIYIDACKSADFAFDNFSLIEAFKSQSDLALRDVDVFGRFGDVGIKIPLPTAATEWARAR